MCYDQTSSLTSWIIGFIAGIILFLRNRTNDRWIAMFVITFTGIQFIEYKLWKSIDENNDIDNEYWTKVALLDLWAQALILTIGAFVWGQVASRTKIYFMILIISFICMVMFAIKAMNAVSNPMVSFKTTVGQNGHLVWRQYEKNANETKPNKRYFIDKDYTIIAGLVYLIGLFLPHLFMVQEARVVYLTLFGLATFLYSHINYWETGEFSSMWCYLSVVYALIAVIN